MSNRIRRIGDVLWTILIPLFIISIMVIMVWAITHEDPVKAWWDGYQHGRKDTAKEYAR